MTRLAAGARALPPAGGGGGENSCSPSSSFLAWSTEESIVLGMGGLAISEFSSAARSAGARAGAGGELCVEALPCLHGALTFRGV